MTIVVYVRNLHLTIITLYVPYATCLKLDILEVQRHHQGSNKAVSKSKLRITRGNPWSNQDQMIPGPLKWEKVGDYWPTKMSNTAWWLYDVNLNESRWLLVPPPSDVGLPQKTRDHVVQYASIMFNICGLVETFLESMPTCPAYCLTLYCRF